MAVDEEKWGAALDREARGVQMRQLAERLAEIERRLAAIEERHEEEDQLTREQRGW